MQTRPPPKPYLNFPLFPAKNGQWRKDVRVNGGKPRPFYFGPWADDPKGERAIKEWLEREPAIRAGLDHTDVRKAGPAFTVVELLRRFLAFKQEELLANRLSDETFRDYVRECNYLGTWAGPTAQVAGFTGDHFAAYRLHMETSRKLGVDRLATNIKMIRAAFNYGHRMGWTPAPHYGASFHPPATDPESKAAAKLRAGQDAEDEPIFTPAQVQWLLKRVPPLYKAAMLVALNCGMGPSDLARLKWRNIRGKRLSLRRGKTGVRRECYLWKRTREALEKLKELPAQKAAIAKEGDEAVVFLNKSGLPIVTRKRKMDGAKVKTIKISSSFSATFGDYIEEAKAAGVIPKNEKLTFYTCRHTYYDHAENGGDLNALHRTTGHALAGQGRRYKRKPFPLPRLKRIAMRVHRALWPVRVGCKAAG